MRKLTAAVLICFLLICGVSLSMAESGKLSVIATIFPIYDWVREIAGDSGAVEVTLLLDKATDLHSYQPSAGDIAAIAGCDLFLYVGGESDAWVESALSVAGNPNRRTVNLMETLGEGVQEEELVEGMQAEEEEEEPEGDEHVWLSLRNARLFCEQIAGALSELDSAHADVYAANCAAYTEKLAELDAAYQKAVDSAAFRTLLFADRFPFRYLVGDYDLSYYAAFSGCSAETEASFATVVFLAGKLDELGLPAVLSIEGTDHRIAETVISASSAKNQSVLTMDSMQGTTLKDAQAGKTYLSIMCENLNVLREALQAGK